MLGLEGGAASSHAGLALLLFAGASRRSTESRDPAQPSSGMSSVSRPLPCRGASVATEAALVSDSSTTMLAGVKSYTRPHRVSRVGVVVLWICFGCGGHGLTTPPNNCLLLCTETLIRRIGEFSDWWIKEITRKVPRKNWFWAFDDLVDQYRSSIVSLNQGWAPRAAQGNV